MLILLQLTLVFAAVSGLRPQDSETRYQQTLDGRWKFMLNPSGEITAPQLQDAILHGNFSNFGEIVYDMPVPGSFNDITMNGTVHNYIGWSFFWRDFYVPALLKAASASHRFFLRFDSVNYYCDVYLNSKQITSHEGGHLPFETEVTAQLNADGPNTLIVVLNNTLNATTVPPAQFQWKKGPNYPPDYFEQTLNMDFFNYAGVQRSVHLFTKPSAAYIDNVHVLTAAIMDSGLATLNWTVQLQLSTSANVRLRLQLFDAQNVLNSQYEVVTREQSNSGQMKVTNAVLWWPRSLGIDANGHLISPPNGAPSGYLYTLQVSVLADNGDNAETLLDSYRLKIGVRTVRLSKLALLINEKPLYCTGVNMHEDADIRGRAFDMSMLLRNFESLDWLGVNCIRTSHYPYAEEFLDMADHVGVAVFDEVPAVGLGSENFVERTFEQHCRTIADLVLRDRNRPSVIGWSLANEPAATAPSAKDYFARLFAFARTQDPLSGRPLIYTITSSWNSDLAAPNADITALNRYYAWYSDLGRIELIDLQLKNEVAEWFAKYPRPIMFTEFGAEAISGLHKWPAVPFSEDYQLEFLIAYHNAFDELRRSGVPMIGELIWNFADFETDLSVSRVDGNHKGLFTRQRQPKLAAHYVRRRYRGMNANATTFDPRAAPSRDSAIRYSNLAYDGRLL